MFWKIYFWIFTPTALIIQALNPLGDRGMNFLNILVVLAAIAALHAIAFEDFTIPKQLWRIAFLCLVAGFIISIFLYKPSFAIWDLVIYFLLLPVIYAVYKLAFKRKF